MRALMLLAAALTAGVAATAELGQANRPLFLVKPAGTIRVFTYNVGDDSVFPAAGARGNPWGLDGPARFLRIVRALQPDVLCLQEATVGTRRAADMLNDALPLGEGVTWYAHDAVDNVILARFPLSAQADGVVEQGTRRKGHAMALVDLPDATFRGDLYLVCAHFQSSGGRLDLAFRQRQSDAIASWIRDAKTPGGAVTLPPRTPFVVLGDMNVIDDPAPYLRTLLSGDIADEGKFGEDFRPDWDETDLADTLPRHNGTGTVFYTWRNDTQRFPAGALDRVLYSDSVLNAANAFVLNTTRMSRADLRTAGLRRADVLRDPRRDIHDHLPVVVDFALRPFEKPSVVPSEVEGRPQDPR